MHLGGQNGARWTSQMYLDKVGKQGQIMPGIPRQARPNVSRQVQLALNALARR